MYIPLRRLEMLLLPHYSATAAAHSAALVHGVLFVLWHCMFTLLACVTVFQFAASGWLSGMLTRL